MAMTRYNPAAEKPLSPPRADTILGDAMYRGYRIVCTNDPNFCANVDDKWGFRPPCVYVVLDEMDDVVFQPGMAAFFTPDDAAAAIEMRDTIFPTIKKHQPATSLMYEYGRFRQYRLGFWIVYDFIVKAREVLENARAMEDNPTDDLLDRLSNLHRQVMTARGIA